MDAKDHPVISVLGDQRRFVVPIFQRQYSWGEERLAPFWDDVVAKAEEALQGKLKFSHYMGALILAPGGDGFVIGMTPRVLVIDGQQRLTTFQLFLAALREVGQQLGVPDIESLVHSYLHVPRMTGDTKPDATFRLIPTPEDRAVFHLIVGKGLDGVRNARPEFFHHNGNLKKNAAPNSVRAFWFLVNRIERYAQFGLIDDDDEATPLAGDDDSDAGSRLHALLQALLNHLKLVVITLSEDDDAQVIFETLNSKAEPLLAMDLVRNNIFHRAAAQGESVEDLFQNKWRLFDSDGPFWKADSPRAKPKRPRIDHFLSHALTAQTGEETSLRELYSEYRAFTRPKGKARFPTVGAELDALISFAPVYRELEEATGDSDLAWVGRKLHLWEVSTAYPLTFRIAVSNADQGEKQRLYTLIYSYLVRRALCGLTPKSLNKTFARLTRQMIAGGVSVESFKAGFVEQRGDAVRFPDDTELSAAIQSKPAYHMLSRKDRLAELLWDLEMATRDKFAVATPRPPSMSVEHIMPQAWTNHWRLADGRLVPKDRMVGGDDAIQREIQARDGALHTLGNLTLITVPGNTVASDSEFSEKAVWLAKSLLALNLEIIEKRQGDGNEALTWDVARISNRSKLLASRAVVVWPAP
jgi:uncharacterized protein with ParB-like and HNH nuclease domain